MSSNRALASVPTSGGDIFVGGNRTGTIGHYDSAGVLKETLSTGLAGQGSQETGMCHDGAGDLYATNFGGVSVTKFDSSGNILRVYRPGSDGDSIALKGWSHDQIKESIEAVST